MVSFKGAHFVKDIILTCVRWYRAYPLSHSQMEELMQERGTSVDHAKINRWVLKYSPQLEAAFHHRKRPVWISWRMNETSIRMKRQWRYLYRAVDERGQTIDFLLTEERDEQAAKRFLTKAIRRHGVPAKIIIDGSGANAAAIRGYNEGSSRALARATLGWKFPTLTLSMVRRVPSPALVHVSCTLSKIPYDGLSSVQLQAAVSIRDQPSPATSGA